MKKVDYERLAAIYACQLKTDDLAKKQYIKVLIFETANKLHVDKKTFIDACGLK